MVRWGIIGCGDVADRKSGPAFNQVEGSELVAVMRRDAAKSREFAKKHGAKKWYTKVENLLADEDINAIYVATPVHLHCEHTIAAADAGKHVLCEKPMAVNVAQCQQMIQACKSNGVKLMIAYYRRFYPSVKKMKEVMESGAIGDIVLARVNLTGYYNPSQPGEWRTDPLIAGGGVMMDVGSHRLDLLIHLLGDVEKVGAFVDTLHCNYAVEDSAALVMKFKSGAHAVSNFNWNVGSGSDDFEIY
ncbi:MAG: Gfo/Idh/MocA family protein, partial [bacterium]